MAHWTHQIGGIALEVGERGRRHEDVGQALRAVPHPRAGHDPGGRIVSARRDDGVDLVLLGHRLVDQALVGVGLVVAGLCPACPGVDDRRTGHFRTGHFRTGSLARGGTGSGGLADGRPLVGGLVVGAGSAALDPRPCPCQPCANATPSTRHIAVTRRDAPPSGRPAPPDTSPPALASVRLGGSCAGRHSAGSRRSSRGRGRMDRPAARPRRSASC